MSAIVMTYGRFNPPTTGHQMLIEKMTRISGMYMNVDHFVYLSPTTGKDNPLDFDFRYRLMTKAFGKQVCVSEVQHKDIFAAVKWVSEIGYSELYLVVGGDRHAELAKRLPMYNNGKLYRFNEIHVLNAGIRNDSDGIEGMSASRLREAAKLGDYETFESGLPLKLRSMSRDIYERVRESCASRVLETT